jgi:hypothetical protein
MPPARLRDVIDGLEMAADWLRVYINRATGEVAHVTLEEASWTEEEEPDPNWPEWQVKERDEALRVLNCEDFIALPTEFEINHWSIMKRFAESLANQNDCDDLLQAIHGRGAFRMFNTIVARRGLDKAWFKFRGDALAEIAIDFLEERQIPYTSD